MVYVFTLVSLLSSSSVLLLINRLVKVASLAGGPAFSTSFARYPAPASIAVSMALSFCAQTSAVNVTSLVVGSSHVTKSQPSTSTASNELLTVNDALLNG